LDRPYREYGSHRRNWKHGADWSHGVDGYDRANR